MLKIISPKRAQRILQDYADWIDEVASRYGVPSAVIKAILYQEMTMMDVMDPVADLVAYLGILPKKDSSTGFAQIFGYVGLNAVNYAVDQGLASYESLGIDCGHRLDAGNNDDVRLVWRHLHRNPKANIEIATLNLLVAADEVVGHTRFADFSEDELKLVLTRYNADVRSVTPYGERAYQRYLEFREEEAQHH